MNKFLFFAFRLHYFAFAKIGGGSAKKMNKFLFFALALHYLCGAKVAVAFGFNIKFIPTIYGFQKTH
ncbi:MAG: hypothetical protein IKH52_04495 [Bacteroidaceae bacterium]|nr:hypothetical protein [Bacteroidaceae bacterium]